MGYRLVRLDDLTPQDIASVCDHTFLNRSEAFRSYASKMGKSAVTMRKDAFEAFIEKTKYSELKPYALCVRPEDVPYAKENLGDYMKITSVVGFPDGSHYDTYLKKLEVEFVANAGADEIDMVLDYEGFKKGGDFKESAKSDILNITQVGQDYNLIVKLILETCELSANQIAEVSNLAQDFGVDFIKTSTGFGTYGARPEDLAIMRENFRGGIKISGGVTPNNIRGLLYAVCGHEAVTLNPLKIRIGESSLLSKL